MIADSATMSSTGYDIVVDSKSAATSSPRDDVVAKSAIHPLGRLDGT